LIQRDTVWKKNAVDTRVRPSDLIAASTPLFPQSFEIEDCGYQETPGLTDWDGNTHWSGDDLREGRRFRQYDEIPFWNWPLQLRLQLENLQVNLGTTLAEYRQTVQQFSGLAKAAFSAAERLRQFRKFKRAPISAIGGYYLGYSFGLKPTVSELAAAVASLNTALKRPIYRHATVSKSEVRRLITLSGNYSIKSKLAYRLKAKSYYLVEPSYDGITFGNPAEWAWELTPFSFVVDWGINIGEHLQVLDALVGITDIITTYSEKSLYSHDKINTSPDVLMKNKNVVQKRYYKRDLLDTIPMPSTIEWDPSESYYTAANATALLASILGKTQYKRPSVG
jgi:hypothetical protein